MWLHVAVCVHVVKGSPQPNQHALHFMVTRLPACVGRRDELRAHHVLNSGCFHFVRSTGVHNSTSLYVRLYIRRRVYGDLLCALVHASWWSRCVSGGHSSCGERLAVQGAALGAPSVLTPWPRRPQWAGSPGDLLPSCPCSSRSSRFRTPHGLAHRSHGRGPFP